MPRTYPPEAKREAFGLYCSGLSLEQVAAAMRQKGFARYSVETLRRWAADGGWEADRAKLANEEARLGLALDAERITAEMLAGYQELRNKTRQKLEAQELKFEDGVGLLLKIDALIRTLLAAQKSTVQPVDKAALALEMLELVVVTLAELDPAALEFLQPHIPALGEALKARYAEAA
jgi:hypothetical protein